MNDEHRKILCDLRDYLVKEVDFQHLKPLLLDYKIFNKYMWEDIDSMEDLLDALPQRGPKAFKNIIEILQKRGYDSVADVLETFNSELLYKMSSQPLGYCLIINNVDFEKINPNDPNEDRTRYGSDTDAESLSCFFKNAGFEVLPLEPLRNMKAVDMTNYLKNFSKCEDLANVDSLIVIIMSHGANVDNVDIICGTDNNYVKKPDICNLFNNENCELLHNKPKIFIFISCRGREMDYGVYSKCMPNESKETGCKNCTKNDSLRLPNSVSSDAAVNYVIISTITEMFIVHSTLPCQTSLRDCEKGSYFCQAFIDVLNIYYRRHDLHRLTIDVNRRLLSKVSREYHITQSAHYEFLGAFKTFKFCSS